MSEFAKSKPTVLRNSCFRLVNRKYSKKGFKGGVMSKSILRFCIHLVDLTLAIPKMFPFLKLGVWETHYGVWKFKNRGPGENNSSVT